MDTKAILNNAMMSHQLDGGNYRAWKFQIKTILQSQELLEIVDGTDAKPDDNVPADQKKKWNKKDGKATAILFASINQEQKLHVLDCKSAKEIFDTLQNIHQKKSDVRIMTLYEDFFA